MRCYFEGKIKTSADSISVDFIEIVKERADMVATNIGNIPIEDYREIVATQNGFDSYDEM